MQSKSKTGFIPKNCNTKQKLIKQKKGWTNRPERDTIKHMRCDGEHMPATSAGSSLKMSTTAAWWTLFAPSQISENPGIPWTGLRSKSRTSLATPSFFQGPGSCIKQSAKALTNSWRVWKSARSIFWPVPSVIVGQCAARGVMKVWPRCRHFKSKIWFI